MNMNTMMEYITYGLALIGGLAFLVSVIVQVIKEMPGLNKIPTSVVALATSMILCPVALIVLCTYYKMVLCIRSICRGICGVSGINRRMGKDQEHLGQNKIQ